MAPHAGFAWHSPLPLSRRVPCGANRLGHYPDTGHAGFRIGATLAADAHGDRLADTRAPLP